MDLLIVFTVTFSVCSTGCIVCENQTHVLHVIACYFISVKTTRVFKYLHEYVIHF